jgi:predicted PurR-regulated permease PerM
MQQKHPYEESFLLALLLIALVSLIWLFNQFIPAFLFALLLATSSYSLFQKLSVKPRMNANRAAMLMTTAAFLVVFLPISYLLAESGRMGAEVFNQLQNWLGQQSPASIRELEQRLLASTPLPEDLQHSVAQTIEQQLPTIVEKTKALSLWVASNLFSGITSFIGFMAIALFSLFFFYRDGQSFIKRLVNLSPLSNNLDHFILRRFAALSNVLTVSVLGVAMIQGLAFSLLMLVFGLPWLFLGLAFAITSFIPVVGGLLVWGPVVLYFLIEGSPWLALVTALYSAIFIGIVIDNLLRTVLIQRLSQQYRKDAGRNALDHTWLTLLSTFAGLLHFGMMGLIFGPMLAAMAITIFDVYEHKHRHQLDYS